MLTGKPDAGNPPVRFGGRGGELHLRSYPDLFAANSNEMTFAYRQDFGFGNPNMAGALFAVLVLSVFLVPAKGRWMGVLLTVAKVVALCKFDE